MSSRTLLIWRAVLMVLLVAVVCGRARAQEKGVVWRGEPGLSETVAQIMERQALNDRAPLERNPAKKIARSHPDRGILPQAPDSLGDVPRWPWDGNWNDPSGAAGAGRGFPSIFEQRAGGDPRQMLPQVQTTSFLGGALGDSGFIPPDTMGGVSPTQVLVFLNGRIRVFDRNGNLGGLNATTDVFFNSVRNGSGTSDPRVIWDRLSQRWFLVMITVSTPNRILIAVSNSSTITSTSSFTFFQFQQDLVGTTPNVDTGQLADYPSLGVDNLALYTGANMFTSAGAFSGTSVWVIRKSDLLAGTLTVTAFRDVVAGSAGEGPYAPRGVSNEDPASTEGYFVGASNIAFGRLVLRRISDPGGTPSISANILIPVPATANPRTVPAQGSTTNIEASDDRLYEARIVRERTTGARTLWTAHAIGVNTSGVGSSSTGYRDGSRWYQLASLSATPVLLQSGTLFDSAATNPTHYIFPSCVMTGQGHMAIGATSGGAAEFLQVSVAGRLASDPTGATQPRTVAQSSSTSYTVLGNSRNRWGDYSATMVDPLDDQSVWTFQEYCNGTDSWAVRVLKLLAPPPATPTSCSPSSITAGTANVDVVVTGASVAGSAFYDTEPGFNRLAAAFSGTGITVNSITFSHATPTQFTVNVSVSPAAAAGARDLTVTNPDGQTGTGLGLLTVTVSCTAPNITTSPSSQTACTGGGVSFIAAAGGTPAPTFQWRKNTNPIAGATSAAYTINPVGPGDVGSYDCVATNSCGSATTSAATLTVNSAPGISGQPSNLTACTGAQASFTVSASGTPAPSFQWRHNTSNVPGATAATLTIDPVGPADAGSYDCVVTNSCGAATSSAATLTVNAAPSFSQSPAGTTACTGAGASFTVAVSGTPAPTLQWRHNTVDIPGATGATLNIASVSAGDGGSYDCVATSTCGVATSSEATLTVNAGPVVDSSPTGLSVCEGAPAVLSASFTGTPAPTLQWRRNSSPLFGQTATTLNIAAAALTDSGTYDCVATNSCGSVTSTAAVLTVNLGTGITQQPTPQGPCRGGSATFTIAAVGHPTPTFQWRKNSVDIPGATGSSLTISPALPANEGSYDCVVTADCGVVVSNAVSLSITCPTVADVAGIGNVPGCDGQVTVDDLVYFLARFFDADVAVADVAGIGNTPNPDGQVTVDDLVVFLSAFFAACP